MTLIFIWFYAFILLCFIFAAVFIARLRHKLHKSTEATYQMEDILDSAPDGYFCTTIAQGKEYTHCSRRLCLLLNIVEQNTSLSTVLNRLSANDARLLMESVQNLKQKNMPFDLTVATLEKKRYFNVTGRVLHMSNPHQKSFVLWFKDMTYKTVLLIEERQAYTHLLQQREILTKTLNALPFPLYVEDTKQNVCFANKAYETSKDDTLDMHWADLPLPLGKNTFLTLKYGQDKTTEEGLRALLSEAEKAHRSVLKELPYGIVLFNASAHITFFNNAFCDLWNIDAQWLKKEPSYATFLDKVQEKGLLPQVKDFAQYKKIQMNTFAQLTKPTEEFLYLPGGQIIRRLMIQYAQGGVLMLDERKTTPDILLSK
ncbi:MAG: PAS domain-containing protein [Alphaproteobacteria bacterium]|nr:PAS domain-containing protein [Alphaproteobacteria bacterium]